MRKDTTKKVLAVLLACAMVFTCACGKKGTGEGTNGSAENGSTVTTTSLNEDYRNYVYSLSDIDAGLQNGGNISYVCRNKDGLYGLKATYNENEGTCAYEIVGIGSTADVHIALPGENDSNYECIAADDEGNFYLSKATYINLGAATVIADDDAESDTEDDDSEEEPDVIEGTVEIKGDGGISHTVSTDSDAEEIGDEDSDYDDYEDMTVENEIIKVSPSGETLWSAKVEPAENGYYTNIRQIICIDDNTVLTNGSTGVFLYDMASGDCAKLESDMLKTDDDSDYYDRSFYKLRDGKIYLQKPDSNYEYKFYSFDVSTKSFTEIQNAYPEGVWGGGTYYPGVNHDFVYCEDSTISAFDIGGDKKEKLCDFTASDLLLDNYLDYVCENEDNTFIIEAGLAGENTGFYKLTKIPPEDVVEKETMSLYTVFLDDDVRKSVVRFNQRNDKYRIKIKDFGDGEGDYTDIMNNLNLAITSGDVPDIMVLNTYTPYDSYIKKGLMEPLDSYLENDEELSSKKFLQNVMEAGRRNGKLYMLVPKFAVDTCVAAESELGGETLSLMNYDELCKKNNVNVSEMMGYMNRASATLLYENCGSEFIDWENNKCNFDSPAFVKLLELIKQLPEYDENADIDYDKFDSYYREKKSILLQAYMSEFEQYQVDKKGYFGEDIVFNGYPTESGAKSYLYPSLQLAMSSNCKDKDAAWDFLRYFLTDDYQTKIEWNFPVSEDALDAMTLKAQEPPYYIDENGEKQTIDSSWGVGGIDVKITAITKEEAEQFANFLKSVTDIKWDNTKITEIIEEEAGAFYEGQKSAEEVADIIQSRVSIYMSENM